MSGGGDDDESWEEARNAFLADERARRAAWDRRRERPDGEVPQPIPPPSAAAAAAAAAAAGPPRSRTQSSAPSRAEDGPPAQFPPRQPGARLPENTRFLVIVQLMEGQAFPVPQAGRMPRDVNYIVGQLERGRNPANDRAGLHLQMYIETSRRMNYNVLRQNLIEFGWESVFVMHAYASQEANRAYATKDETCEMDELGNPICRFEEGTPAPVNATQTYQTMLSRIQEGAQLSDIMREFPTLYFRNLPSIQRAISMHEVAPAQRDVEVIVIYGQTGDGKTSHVHRHVNANNLYLKHPRADLWDGYEGQSDVLFDDYAPTGSDGHKITDDLRAFDRYPLRLNARYVTPWAKYTRVWITTNVHPLAWYPKATQAHRDALMRRLKNVYSVVDGELVHVETLWPQPRP
jgi:hypothetical protein